MQRRHKKNTKNPLKQKFRKATLEQREQIRALEKRYQDIDRELSRLSEYLIADCTLKLLALSAYKGGRFYELLASVLLTPDPERYWAETVLEEADRSFDLLSLAELNAVNYHPLVMLNMAALSLIMRELTKPMVHSLIPPTPYLPNPDAHDFSEAAARKVISEAQNNIQEKEEEASSDLNRQLIVFPPLFLITRYLVSMLSPGAFDAMFITMMLSLVAMGVKDRLTDLFGNQRRARLDKNFNTLGLRLNTIVEEFQDSLWQGIKRGSLSESDFTWHAPTYQSANGKLSRYTICQIVREALLSHGIDFKIQQRESLTVRADIRLDQATAKRINQKIYEKIHRLLSTKRLRSQLNDLNEALHRNKQGYFSITLGTDKEGLPCNQFTLFIPENYARIFTEERLQELFPTPNDLQIKDSFLTITGFTPGNVTDVHKLIDEINTSVYQENKQAAALREANSAYAGPAMISASYKAITSGQSSGDEKKPPPESKVRIIDWKIPSDNSKVKYDSSNKDCEIEPFMKMGRHFLLFRLPPNATEHDRFKTKFSRQKLASAFGNEGIRFYNCPKEVTGEDGRKFMAVGDIKILGKGGAGNARAYFEAAVNTSGTGEALYVVHGVDPNAHRGMRM